MAEKGVNFDDLSERLNNFPEPSSAKDIEDKLAKLINPQPQFTLTAEEVDVIQRALGLLSNDMCVQVSYNPYAKEYYDKANNLLTRIEQWQDEQNDIHGERD